MDLKEIRKEFLPRDLAYAFSYATEVFLRVADGDAVATDDGLAARGTSDSGTAADPHVGHLFHVFDSRTAVTADGRQFDTPLGHVVRAEESLVFRGDGRGASVRGSQVTELDPGGPASVTYTGKLQFDVHANALFSPEAADRAVTGRVFLVPAFETALTRFHWLVERSCVGFGTWTAEPTRNGRRKVVSRIDLYTAE